MPEQPPLRRDPTTAWPRVGVRVAFTMPAGHAQLAGVARYASLHGPWTLLTHPRGGFASLSSDQPFDGDGMIVHAAPQSLAELHALPCPVVNVGALVADTGLPSVIPDSLATGRLAAEHLIERGFTQLGFCGFEGHGYSDQRKAGVADLAQRRGATLHRYAQTERHMTDKGSPAYFEAEQANMMAWLRELPKPVGVICANDMRSRQLLAACQRAGLAVPERVAIIGADNDELLCETALPPLSSVAIDFERLGYEAAALLDRLMQGEAPPKRPRLLAPAGVIERQSTDILAIRDPELAQALRQIRENAGDDEFTIATLLRVVPVGRRSLERKFRDALGRTPHEEITRIRVEQAKRLLSQSELSMPHVAARAGFSSAERLSVVFKRVTGQTPTAFRQNHRTME